MQSKIRASNLPPFFAYKDLVVGTNPSALVNMKENRKEKRKNSKRKNIYNMGLNGSPSPIN